MIDQVMSKNGVPIRLTDERWSHITEEHCELAGMRLEVLETISDPERVLEGNYGALMAARETNQESIWLWYTMSSRKTDSLSPHS